MPIVTLIVSFICMIFGFIVFFRRQLQVGSIINLDRRDAVILFVIPFAVFLYAANSLYKTFNPPSTSQIGENRNPIYSIGLTPTSFGESWNQLAIQYDSPRLMISSFTIKYGDIQSAFRYDFDSVAGLVVVVNNRDQTIRYIDFLCSPIDFSTYLNAMIAWDMLIQVTNTNLSVNDRNRIMDSLGLQTKKNWRPFNLNQRCSIGQLSYRTLSSKETCIIFNVGNKDDH